MSFKPRSATGIAETLIAARIREYEEALLDPAVRRRVGARIGASGREFRLRFGASGRTWNREQIVDQLATEEYIQPTMDDFECSMITDSVVLATYKTVRIDTMTGTRAVSLRSSLWTKDSGGWLLRFHQGTRAT